MTNLYNYSVTIFNRRRDDTFYARNETEAREVFAELLAQTQKDDIYETTIALHELSTGKQIDWTHYYPTCFFDWFEDPASFR